MNLFSPETFRTSRLLDFSSQRELTAQIGHEPALWPLVTVKELCDNALDAAEQVNVAPRIRVTLHGRMIEVVDNGPGIAGDVIDDILDFTIRVSSREAYVGPWRGAQGNALKTLLAMPFALDGKAGLVEIRSRGVRYRIRIAINPIAQQPEIEIERAASLVKTGTTVRVHWPDIPRWTGGLDPTAFPKQLRGLVERFALFNPHVRIACRIDGQQGCAWEPTDLGWKRWRPSDPLVAAWYDNERFERLFCALLNADRQQGRVRLVRDILASFRGLSGTAKRKEILAELDLARATLEDLVTKGGVPDKAKLPVLLHYMKQAGTAPRPAALGIIGRDHFLERLQLSGSGLESFEYRRVVDEDSLSPKITELAFAYDERTMRTRRVLCGINSSPALMNASAFRSIDGSALDSMLGRQELRGEHPVVFVLHHTGARLAFADRGKSALSIEGEHGVEVERGIVKTTDKWRKQHEREIRDNRASARREEIFAKRAAISQKTAAAEIMVQAYLKASTGGTLPVSARQIMYAARDHIQARTGKTLDSKYFIKTLLIDYMDENREATASWDVVFDARGNLVEPHTRKVIPLSTLAVRAYVKTKGWRNKYGAVLFVEKEGFQPLFEAVGLLEEYDIAIMSTKGTSVTAARTLIDALITDGVPVYCVRDFDVNGFNIAATLARDTQRYSWSSAGAIDLGLRLADVEAYGLAKEGVLHKKGKRVLHIPAEIREALTESLRRDGATKEEIDFLLTHRVELNAFASGDLIAWLKAKFTENNVHKVVPDEVTLAEKARSMARAIVELKILKSMTKEIDERVDAIDTDELRPDVEQRLEAERAMSWNDALRRIVQQRADRPIDPQPPLAL